MHADDPHPNPAAPAKITADTPSDTPLKHPLRGECHPARLAAGSRCTGALERLAQGSPRAEPGTQQHPDDQLAGVRLRQLRVKRERHRAARQRQEGGGDLDAGSSMKIAPRVSVRGPRPRGRPLRPEVSGCRGASSSCAAARRAGSSSCSGTIDEVMSRLAAGGREPYRTGRPWATAPRSCLCGRASGQGRYNSFLACEYSVNENDYFMQESCRLPPPLRASSRRNCGWPCFSETP